MNELPQYKRGDPIYQYKLMLKQHYDTGYNYLCITKREDWQKYTGSGVMWKNLIKNSDSEILTTLLFTTDSLEELAEISTAYSAFFDIPYNKTFLNAIPETGYEGNQGNLNAWWEYASEEDKAKARAKGVINRENTCLEKYGVDNTMHIARAVLQEMLNEIGVTNIMQIPEVAAKCRQSNIQTLLERYGVDNCTKIPEVAAKIKEGRESTLLEKHGVRYPLQIPGKAEQARDSREATMLKTYGVRNISQVPEFSKKRGDAISEAKQNAPMVKCQFCDFEGKNVTLHEKHCQSNPNRIDRPLVECEHCHLKTTAGNYARWHGDNCKEKV